MKLQQSLPEMRCTDKTLRVRFLGSSVSYEDGMHAMRDAIARVHHEAEDCSEFELLFLEHKDTITTTRQNGSTSLIQEKSDIEARGIDVLETDRGGDVTFHGQGQLVGYLVVRLSPVDLVGYVRTLEGALLNSVQEFGIKNSLTLPQKTGVWVQEDKDTRPRKLIAIGVGVSKGVTRHGFALNVSTDLERFTSCIVPCGLHGFGVTSLARENIELPTLLRICKTIANQIAQQFGLRLQFEKNFQPSW